MSAIGKRPKIGMLVRGHLNVDGSTRAVRPNSFVFVLCTSCDLSVTQGGKRYQEAAYIFDELIDKFQVC